MKIGFIIDDTISSNAGVQRYVKILTRWFLKEGHKVKIISGGDNYDEEFKKITFLASQNISVRFNKSSHTMPLWPKILKIKKFLKKEKFDILHLQMPYSPLMGQIILQMSNTPVVGTNHISGENNYVKIGAKFLGLIQRFSNQKIQRQVAVSLEAKRFAKKYFGANIKSVIPLPIEIKKEKKPDIKKEKYEILYMGRLTTRKGIMYLMEAILKLKDLKLKKDFILNIVGKGYLEDRLKEFVKANKLESNVRIFGYISESEKEALLERADLCVFPSFTSESFGYVILEAMTNQTLFLAGENRGYSELLKKDLGELLIDVKDTDKFANKIVLFLEDEELKSKYLEIIKEKIQQYDVEKIGTRVLKEYFKARKIFNDD